MAITTEKHAFQAEIAQLLEIVIHSLYTDKEIFVRELISNAADASEKLQFLQTSGTAVFQPELSLKISVATDDQAKTISFTDAGIGMTHAELVENLGTIAHSGSKAFLEQVKANKGDAHLIGQFGVGFYAAFMRNAAPINEIGITTTGMSTDRNEPRKRKMTTTTINSVSVNVRSTSFKASSMYFVAS